MTPIDKIPSDQKPKAKRFWTETSLKQSDDGYIIALDGREVKTPQGSAMRVPQRSLADAICQEWDGQKEEINPESMPMFKFTVTAIDRVTPQRGMPEFGSPALLGKVPGTHLMGSKGHLGSKRSVSSQVLLEKF